MLALSYPYTQDFDGPNADWCKEELMPGLEVQTETELEAFMRKNSVSFSLSFAKDLVGQTY